MSKVVTWTIDSEQPTALQAALEAWSKHFERSHLATSFTVDGLTFDLAEFTEHCAMAGVVETVIEHGIDHLSVEEFHDYFVVKLHNAEGAHNISAFDESADADAYVEQIKTQLCLTLDNGGTNNE